MVWQGWLLRMGKALSPLLTAKAVGDATLTVQKKTDAYIGKKRDEFVSQAKTEAERFMAEQMALIEAKVDEKIIEIEQRIDAQIEKELRNKLHVLIYTLLAVIFMSLISLGYLYLKRRFAL